jgi:FkbM family methyltransferase
MKNFTRTFLNNLLSKFNLRLVNQSYWTNVNTEIENYRTRDEITNKNKIIEALNPSNVSFLEKYKGLSTAQILQDILVLDFFSYKENGFYVEFGATNGLDLSNTYILEKHFNWSGILAEPAKKWHKDLNINRNCKIETDCVWSTTGDTLQFVEAKSAELSTVSEFENSDIHAKVRIKRKKYNVRTISLMDLLIRHMAPKRIEYLSIDTEGSEYEILKNFDFSKYLIGVITCEHNFGTNREKIRVLLESNGFLQINREISQFDDWYVNSKWAE